MSVGEITAYIDGLYEKNALHVKRGYPIRNTNATVTAVHLAEEVVELQAAALLDGSKDEQLEEAADTLLIYCHLLRHLELEFNQVADFALQKLKGNWTTNPSEVTAVRPGLTRSGRKENA